MNGLSKSKYTTFCQCPKALWMKVHKPDEMPKVDKALQARFDMGKEVGKKAQKLFGSPEDVTKHTPDNKLDLSAMVKSTEDKMAHGTNNICEASFAKDGNYCAVDILHRNGDGWDIYEVKSSTSSAGEELTKTENFRKYAIDIAYQRWLLEQCGVNVKGTYLVTLNRDYVFQGSLDIHKLFNILNLHDLVENELLKVPAQVAAAQQMLQQQDEPVKALGCHCRDPYGCAFWDYCCEKNGLPKDKTLTVLNLYSLRWNKKFEYLNQGKIYFDDVKDELTNKIQLTQVDCTLKNTEYIDKAGSRDFLSGLSYPLYFLDFETMQPVLPLFDGTSPYQQIVFLYSLHYIEKEGAPLLHKEFLAPSDGSDPRLVVAEQLCKDIPQDVCTLAYNDPFEKRVIRGLAEAFPHLSSELMNIHDHIQDLLVPFKRGCYYVPAMGGSFSIKSVLPALFPKDPSLNYNNLKDVHNGGDAMTIFPQLVKMMKDDPQEAQRLRQALLDYCFLDTFAMVKVWEKLREKAKLVV